MSVTTITIERRDYGAEVSFPFDEHAVEVMRGAHRRRWDKAERCWWIPSADVPQVAQMFRKAGFEVRIIGRPTTSSPAKVVEPVAALLALVPDRLRAPTVKALSKVWHPDVGGDTELMQKLNGAVDALEGRRR